MHDERRAKFVPYLRALADAMTLRDWAFRILDVGPSDEDAMALIRPTYGRRHASIWLSDDFLDDSPEAQRHTLVHELIHCHFAGAQHYLDDCLDGDARAAYRLMLESGVDAVADALAPLLPLPSFPEPGSA